MTLQQIGSVIRKRREELGLQRDQLAQLSGVAIKTIYLIEGGKENSSLRTLHCLLEVLGMDIIIQIKKEKY